MKPGDRLLRRRTVNERTGLRDTRIWQLEREGRFPHTLGSGAHRANDPTTWAWSDNPALCLADWLMWDQVGMGEEVDRIDWELVATAADVCDELVTMTSKDFRARRGLV